MIDKNEIFSSRTDRQRNIEVKIFRLSKKSPVLISDLETVFNTIILAMRENKDIYLEAE